MWINTLSESKNSHHLGDWVDMLYNDNSRTEHHLFKLQPHLSFSISEVYACFEALERRSQGVWEQTVVRIRFLLRGRCPRAGPWRCRLLGPRTLVQNHTGWGSSGVDYPEGTHGHGLGLWGYLAITTKY